MLFILLKCFVIDVRKTIQIVSNYVAFLILHVNTHQKNALKILYEMFKVSINSIALNTSTEY